eukprot:TRINITY_DN4511_c0_g1_i1.p3 TRINITY_DN4511_c0_g1~~TRINITY_DN4511_c0_g1_i1.p3  ORF type:complete len:65 (+),score=12.43 TRINITY_DN4511_c0_g1_i1:248-442(+)
MGDHDFLLGKEKMSEFLWNGQGSNPTARRLCKASGVIHGDLKNFPKMEHAEDPVGVCSLQCWVT